MSGLEGVSRQRSVFCPQHSFSKILNFYFLFQNLDLAYRVELMFQLGGFGEGVGLGARGV